MGKKTKGIVVFGEPDYLIYKFDDVDTAVRSKKSAAAKEARAIVKSKATKKDNLQVLDVIRTKGKFDGKPVSDVIVYVDVGLNGPGKDGDYLAALKRLTDTGRFRIIDAHIDSIDDIWSVLLAFKEAK